MIRNRDDEIKAAQPKESNSRSPTQRDTNLLDSDNKHIQAENTKTAKLLIEADENIGNHSFIDTRQIQDSARQQEGRTIDATYEPKKKESSTDSEQQTNTPIKMDTNHDLSNVGSGANIIGFGENPGTLIHETATHNMCGRISPTKDEIITTAKQAPSSTSSKDTQSDDRYGLRGDKPQPTYRGTSPLPYPHHLETVGPNMQYPTSERRESKPTMQPTDTDDRRGGYVNEFTKPPGRPPNHHCTLEIAPQIVTDMCESEITAAERVIMPIEQTVSRSGSIPRESVETGNGRPLSPQADIKRMADVMLEEDRTSLGPNKAEPIDVVAAMQALLARNRPVLQDCAPSRSKGARQGPGTANLGSFNMYPAAESAVTEITERTRTDEPMGKMVRIAPATSQWKAATQANKTAQSTKTEHDLVAPPREGCSTAQKSPTERCQQEERLQRHAQSSIELGSPKDRGFISAPEEPLLPAVPNLATRGESIADFSVQSGREASDRLHTEPMIQPSDGNLPVTMQLLRRPPDRRRGERLFCSEITQEERTTNEQSSFSQRIEQEGSRGSAGVRAPEARALTSADEAATEAPRSTGRSWPDSDPSPPTNRLLKNRSTPTLTSGRLQVSPRFQDALKGNRFAPLSGLANEDAPQLQIETRASERKKARTESAKGSGTHRVILPCRRPFTLGDFIPNNGLVPVQRQSKRLVRMLSALGEDGLLSDRIGQWSWRNFGEEMPVRTGSLNSGGMAARHGLDMTKHGSTESECATQVVMVSRKLGRKRPFVGLRGIVSNHIPTRPTAKAQKRRYWGPKGRQCAGSSVPSTVAAQSASRVADFPVSTEHRLVDNGSKSVTMKVHTRTSLRSVTIPVTIHEDKWVALSKTLPGREAVLWMVAIELRKWPGRRGMQALATVEVAGTELGTAAGSSTWQDIEDFVRNGGYCRTVSLRQQHAENPRQHETSALSPRIDSTMMDAEEGPAQQAGAGLKTENLKIQPGSGCWSATPVHAGPSLLPDQQMRDEPAEAREEQAADGLRIIGTYRSRQLSILVEPGDWKDCIEMTGQMAVRLVVSAAIRRECKELGASRLGPLLLQWHRNGVRLARADEPTDHAELRKLVAAGYCFEATSRLLGGADAAAAAAGGAAHEEGVRDVDFASMTDPDYLELDRAVQAVMSNSAFNDPARLGIARRLLAPIRPEHWEGLPNLGAVRGLISPARLLGLREILRAQTEAIRPSFPPNFASNRALVSLRICDLLPRRIGWTGGGRSQAETRIIEALLRIEGLSDAQGFDWDVVQTNIKIDGDTTSPDTIWSILVVLPQGPWIQGLLSGRLLLAEGSYAVPAPHLTYAEVPLDGEVTTLLKGIAKVLQLDMAIFRGMLQHAFQRALGADACSVRITTSSFTPGTDGKKPQVKTFPPEHQDSVIMIGIEATYLLLAWRAAPTIRLELGIPPGIPVQLMTLCPRASSLALRAMRTVKTGTAVRFRTPGARPTTRDIVLGWVGQGVDINQTAGHLPAGWLSNKIINSASDKAEAIQILCRAFIDSVGAVSMMPIGRLKKGGGDPVFLYLMFRTVEDAARLSDAIDTATLPAPVATLLNYFFEPALIPIYCAYVPPEALRDCPEKELVSLFKLGLTESARIQPVQNAN